MNFAEEVAAVTKSTDYKGTEIFDSTVPELPKHDPEAASKVEAASAPAPVEAKVKIGDMEFNSVHEAYAHALAQVAESNKSMQETVQKLTAPKVEPEAPKEAWEVELEKLFFTNPAEAMRQLYAKATTDAVSQIESKTQATQAAQVRAQQYEGFIQGIVTNNAELSDFRTVIENVVLADPIFWDKVKDLPLAKAEIEVANKTRELLKIKKAAEAKTTELPAGPARMAGVTGDPTAATAPVTSNQALDFITQLRKHSKRSK